MPCDPLANPVWSALGTCHAAVAVGTGPARRYPDDITPFAAVATSDVAAREHVRELVAVGQRVVFLGVAPRFDDGWVIERVDQVLQWTAGVAPRERPLADGVVETLGERDRAAMYELTRAVYPHFYRARTAILGTYLGVRIDGALAAMGGERLKLVGFQELSTFCSLPAYRQRGLATAILAALLQRTAAHEQVAFAHTVAGNEGPLRVLRAFGFSHRATLTMWSVRRVA